MPFTTYTIHDHPIIERTTDAETAELASKSGYTVTAVTQR